MITKTKALADVLPEVTISAKEFATAMTSENTRRKDLQGKGSILNEHVTNNRDVRGVMIKRGIYPESLPPSEDIKKIVSRHKKEMGELQKRHRLELAKAANRLSVA